MLTTISVLTFLIFGSAYPLCLWLNFPKPISPQFHKFHLGLPNFIAGVGVVILLFADVPLSIKIFALVWKAAFLSTSSYMWKKENVRPIIVTLISLMGMVVTGEVLNARVGADPSLLFATILGGCVLSSVLYAMNLGHHYLNVHGLPIRHLIRATKVFWAFLAFRFIWDILYLLRCRINYLGDELPLYRFFLSVDGFLLAVAIFFGTVFPFILNYFVMGTLKVKSTQSATGILYVSVICVLMGDLMYRYYLVRFGLAL